MDGDRIVFANAKWCIYVDCQYVPCHGRYINSQGTTSWYDNGKRHRVNGPAIEYINGEKIWIVNNKLHRTNGPAVERHDRIMWYTMEKLHRLDGPAVIYPLEKIQEWWEHGVNIRTESYVPDNTSNLSDGVFNMSAIRDEIIWVNSCKK